MQTRPFRSALALVAASICALLLGSSRALAEGGRATGQVMDDDGTSVAALRLRLVSESGEPASGVPSIEVKKGRFVIPSFPSGTFRLEVDGGSVAIKRFELEVRDSNGARLANMATDVPPRGTAPLFQVASSQRATINVVVGKAPAGAGGGGSIQGARESSASLKKLNELLAAQDMPGLLAESEKVIAAKPDVHQAHYFRGVALWKTGRIEEAVPELRTAVERVKDEPGFEDVLAAALLDLSRARGQAGKDAEAKAAASEAADILARDVADRPADKSALTNRVIALEQAGRSEEAVAAVQQLIAADPGNTAAYYKVAESLTGAGKNEEALQWLDKAPAKDKETATRMYNAAVNLYNKGDMQAVVTSMTKAVAMAPDTAFLHDLLGRALLATGDHPGAVREMREFLRLAPDDPNAEATRALIKAIQ